MWFYWTTFLAFFLLTQSYVRNKRIIIQAAMKSCELYCPDVDPMFPTCLQETCDKKFPPIILHIRSEKYYESLVDLIVDETALSHSFVEELVAFGAVYMATPDKKSKLSTEKGSPGRRENGMSRAVRIVKSNKPIPVPENSYCRVHPTPKRYSGAYNVDWARRIIKSSCNDLIIVDKVADLAISPTTANAIENLVFAVSNYMNITENNCFITSRLDACTSGLTPIGLTRLSASIMSKAFSERRVRKTYKVLCRIDDSSKEVEKEVERRLLSLGSIKHCFRNKRKSHENAKPTLLKQYDEKLLRIVSPENVNEWQLAELIIKKVCKLSASDLDLKELSRVPLRVLRTSDLLDVHDYVNCSFFECEVDLLTGRTHQIRLQFAALGDL